MSDQFYILSDQFSLKIFHCVAAPTGELLRALAVPEAYFETERNKLRGMNETTSKVTVKAEYGGDPNALKKQVYEIANVAQVPSVDSGTMILIDSI